MSRDQNENKSWFILVFSLVVALMCGTAYKLGHVTSREENVGICLRMLEYEQHMTREQATQVWSNELKREGR